MPTMEKRSIVAVMLGLQNESRGTDSYGWFDSATKQVARGMGRIGPDALNMAHMASVLAHTRHATQGPKTLECAHPFRIGRIIGAHNGCIWNHEELNKIRKEAGLEEYEVDSQHIFDALDQRQDFKHMEGYGAIEWVDDDHPDRIYLCKISNGGSLDIASTEYGAAWSSEEKHLKEALDIANIKHDILNTKSNVVYYVEDGVVYYDEDWKLRLSERKWVQVQSYSTTPYGSRMFHDREEEEFYTLDSVDARRQWKLDLVQGAVGSVNGISFKPLSKSERKQLIRERNELIKKSRGSTEKPLKYKDLCKCGAFIGLGEMHLEYCKEARSVILSKPVENQRPELKGIFIGASWVCPDCYQEPQVWDQECPNGHGRVLGNPKADSSAAVDSEANEVTK